MWSRSAKLSKLSSASAILSRDSDLILLALSVSCHNFQLIVGNTNNKVNDVQCAYLLGRWRGPQWH